MEDEKKNPDAPALETESGEGKEKMLETPVGDPPATDPANPSVDPVDKLTADAMRAILVARDPGYLGKELTEDEMRADLKKIRGIGFRQNRKQGEEPSAPETKAPVAALSKEDFHKSNQKSAIKMATGERGIDPTVAKTLRLSEEEVPNIQKEIADNWERVRLYYTPRSGKDTAEDILTDIVDAYAVWKRREGGTGEPADPAAALKGTIKPGSSQVRPVPVAKKEEEDPRFNTKAVDLSSRYPKKKE